MQNALSPIEYNVVQSVFDSLAQAEWFDRTEPNKKECAKMVLLVHSGGVVTPEALLSICEPRARQRFSKRLPEQ